MGKGKPLKAATVSGSKGFRDHTKNWDSRWKRYAHGLGKFEARELDKKQRQNLWNMDQKQTKAYLDAKEKARQEEAEKKKKEEEEEAKKKEEEAKKKEEEAKKKGKKEDPDAKKEEEEAKKKEEE